MNCNQVRDTFLDVAQTGTNAVSREVSTHLAGCAECAKIQSALQQTMLEMDLWESPEPSPYFNTRFQARLAELKREEALAPAGVFGWLRQPAFGVPMWRPMAAGALVFALAVGASLYKSPVVNSPTKIGATEASAAVNDLQKLEKNHDLYSDFDLLDDLKTDGSHSGTSKGSSAEL
jgi:anti-sigma factor RsiW